MIQIRKGKISNLKKLLNEEWAWGGAKQIQDDYIAEIQKGNRMFLAVVANGQTIGELHIFWDNEDKDEANGKNRAYLSTMRLRPDFRRKGIGTKLVKRALKMIRSKGCTEVTIGAYTDEPEIQTLYNRWGFTEPIKESVEFIDGKKRRYVLFLKYLY
jgi:GNAT superfamily N-acetyltransferase